MTADIVKKNLIPLRDFIYGFADLHGLTGRRYDGFNYGISIGKRLDDAIVDKLEYGPTVEYYNHYNQTNADLAEITGKIRSDLLRIRIESIPIPPTISPGDKDYDRYMETLTYDLSHKMVATRAGLGWIGKTDLFISKRFGPRLRLASILLKQKPEIIAHPVVKSKCGKCEICVTKCPAKAANGRLWDINTFRDEFFDAFKCREKCGELASERLNVDVHICGKCVCVCPLGGGESKARERRMDLSRPADPKLQ